jgi:hypothetical protein
MVDASSAEVSTRAGVDRIILFLFIVPSPFSAEVKKSV